MQLHRKCIRGALALLCYKVMCCRCSRPAVPCAGDYSCDRLDRDDGRSLVTDRADSGRHVYRHHRPVPLAVPPWRSSRRHLHPAPWSRRLEHQDSPPGGKWGRGQTLFDQTLYICYLLRYILSSFMGGLFVKVASSNDIEIFKNKSGYLDVIIHIQLRY